MKPIMMTGDTPTGRLHLGHYVGSIKNRLQCQHSHQCYLLIANIHAFTTLAESPAQIHQMVLDIALDYLACGIDPNLTTIFVQSDIPAISELTYWFSMLLPFNRVMRNPTIKDELKTKGLEDNYAFGFPLYAVGQVADILAFRPLAVPVGADQVPHLEMTREVARRFNQWYCGVDPTVADSDMLAHGGLFPLPEPMISPVNRLVGLHGPDAHGNLPKMSKSLNNAILLTESPDEVRKKVMSMYTDPNRVRADIPGNCDNNPLWMLLDAFCTDRSWYEDAKTRYQTGTIGDMTCKKKLADELIALLEPFYRKRLDFGKHPDYILEILRKGAQTANLASQHTLALVKSAMCQSY